MFNCQLYFIALFGIIFISIEARVYQKPLEDVGKTPICGYQSCPKIDPKKLNVHLVAHTHDDVGWLKTVDQYYYGSKTSIQNAGVEYIIDSVIQALKRNPERKFIYVETAFLWKWWQRQDENIREDVRLLINEGRLEIIGGGWSMNDEATTHYNSIVDQFTWGFRLLNDTFGECARPKIGWQIDPFGHSREQASLFAQFGFDGMFLGRLDHEDKAQRLMNKTTEFIWKASSSLGRKAELFSVVLFNTYSPPPGFCFDILCSDEPMIDDPESPDNNIDVKVALFVAYCQVQANSYNTNNIIITMGQDFNYQNAHTWFTNLDKLIKYTNKLYGSKVNVFYSTPSCYVKSVNDAQISWNTKSDDFFPYSSDPHAFWTGYFTSRPALKFFERMGNNLLQIVKQLSVSSNIMDSEDLIQFREAMGVMQHHDAVTGTEKQHVAEDYARLLYKTMAKGANTAAEAIGKKMIEKNNALKVIPKLDSCFLLNISSCIISETEKTFMTIIYNPTSQSLSKYIRVPVTGNDYIVKNSVGDKIATQLVPIPEVILQLPGRVSNATRELVFYAVNIPALGYETFYISDTTSEESMKNKIIYPSKASSIANKSYNITVSSNGDVVIQSKKHDVNIVQSFQYYEGTKGNNTGWTNRASGAYIFRPKESIVHNLPFTGNYKIFEGPLVNEIHLTINQFVSQIVRLYIAEDKIEFEGLIGPIPIEDSIGREVVTKYSSNLSSERTFYTDSNGREMLKRVRDYRPTWNVTLKEKIAGNYYPVTAKIYLEDKIKQLRLSVLNDRAQGGTSMIDGQLELMLHRRLLNDDAFGVGEALNEKAFGKGLVVRGTQYLIVSDLNDIASAELLEKSSTVQLALRPWIFFSSIPNIAFNELPNLYQLRTSSLRKKLPPNVHILTYEPWKDGKVLLRLEHLFEVGQAGALSSPVEVDITDLFNDFKIVSLRETTLGANQWIESMARLEWHIRDNEDNEVNNQTDQVKIQGNTINVLLKPMEIRTFVLTISKRT
ncbi:hypothetical protein PV327_009769 [Microctonus hyperodae]|uniref:Alpha-mannosidase n=1 Tax=Microctonus hyperodae TaxID=165561 RepID=A0AA39F026_MICHY|nr:hypothetical protein PV327_009769 [Microctonus hyperodae]